MRKLLAVFPVKQHLMTNSDADRDSLTSQTFFGVNYKETCGSVWPIPSLQLWKCIFFLQQNNISVIPWLSKTTIIVIVYALGKPHPKSGTIWGWKEQLLTFQYNHCDLAADMTQHDESDNKNGEKKKKKAKQHGQVSNVTSRHQSKCISKGRDFQHTEWDSSILAPNGKPAQNCRPA